MVLSDRYDSFEWIKKQLYQPLKFSMNNYYVEKESSEYEAVGFELNHLKIVARKAKTTPTKAGQFVTFWKRTSAGPIAPFHETDVIDFFVVLVEKDRLLGQFVFPKEVLLEKGIISTSKKEGKRAFRVYPPWDTALNKQATKSQQWQLAYFLSLTPSIDFKKAADLYSQ